MKCSEIQDKLSAYFDGELAADLRATVSLHLEACTRCAKELAVFQKMSSLAKELDAPEPALENWEKIERQIGRQESPDTLVLRIFKKPKRFVAAVLIAASLLLAIGFGSFAILNFTGHAEHDHLAEIFAEYLGLFEKSPNEAQKLLVQKYEGREVSLQAAEKQLGYKPVIARGLPADYQLTKLQLLKMPCCTCPQAVYKRKQGGFLAVFEYEEDQPAWFGNRPCICANCKGISTKIVQYDDKLAATWKNQDRFVTIIGARDVEEVVQLVRHLGSKNS